jgi:uncharacterized protein (TIGR00369 family)
MTAAAPPNPNFAAVVRESFGRQTFMTALGATLERVEPGVVAVRVPFVERHAQQNGFLHAGVLASVADSACGYAALSVVPPEHDVLAVEFKINLLRPARSRSFLAEARVLRAGRTLVVSFAEVHGEDDAGRELVATMLSTVIARPLRER